MPLSRSFRTTTLTVQLCSTVRRCRPTESTERYHLYNERVMKLVAQFCNMQITEVHPFVDIHQTIYEDKLICTTFTLRSDESHDIACETLINKWIVKMAHLNGKTGIFHNLQIFPGTPQNNEEYFENVELETFMLGFMSDPATFHSKFNYDDLRPNTREQPRVTIELDRDKSYVDFVVSKGLRFNKCDPGKKADTTEVYRLMVNHKHLAKRVFVNTTSQSTDVCFVSSMPLQLWRTQWDITAIDKINPESTKWIRASEIKSKSKTAMDTVFDRTTLGGCNVLLLRFNRNKLTNDILSSLAEEGDFSLQHTYFKIEQDTPVQEPVPVITDAKGKYIGSLSWMVAAIHSIGYRIQCQLNDADVQRLYINQIYYGQHDNEHLMSALCRTYDVLLKDADGFLHVDRVLQNFLKRSYESDDPVITTNRRIIKRMVVSPSRILLQPPCLTHDNRILRAFDPESAVICSFQNDDMSGFSTVESDEEFVDEVVGDVLRSGVEVGGRHYEFLGCSGSQLKNNGCWMYAKDAKGYTVVKIREWMGALDSIKNPGTYLARMGQCFSDTSAPEIEDPDIKIGFDGDIEGDERPDGKPYCFSDGIGRISRECLKTVFSHLPINIQHLPSAFQVRLGGCKGMLALDPTLTGKKIRLRLSMYKFDSRQTNVEVMRRTQPTPLFLNRQVITILSQLKGGIPDHVFVRFLYNMLHRMADVFLNDDKALEALTSCGYSCCFTKLNKRGFKFTTDPFFKGMLKVITCSKISQVRRKTRIEIPTDYGRAMLGVLDEASVLNYGEVFVQYSIDMTQTRMDTTIVEGTVVVSKMPSLHPGDVRKFRAVRKKELEHLVDCIVFPQKGKRPHPDEMANSDLDGDEYFVTWHPHLIFKGENAKAMDFISQKKKQNENPVTNEDLIEFMVKSICNDKVGTISLAHLATADKEDIYSKKCLELAEIFCHVIDFPKTGYLPAKIQGKEICNYLPEEYPEFMEKKDHKNAYRSNKILGTLYQVSKRIEEAVKTIDKEDTDRSEAGSNWTIDRRLKVPGHEVFMDMASKLYDIYADYLKEIQTKYGIDSEEELVSGSVTKVSALYGKSPDDVYDISHSLRGRMKDIEKTMQEKFNDLLGKVQTEGSEGNRKRKFASACYVHAYTYKKKFLSFPWVFSEHLDGILQRNTDALEETPMESLSSSIDALEDEEVNHVLRKYKFKKWNDGRKNNISYLLLQWGEKAKFVVVEAGSKEKLTGLEFNEILKRIFQDQALIDGFRRSENSASLLITAMKVLTNLPDHVPLAQSTPSEEAIKNMKRQTLLGHHQLARDPRIDSLMIRKEARKTELIHIDKNMWDIMKPYTGHLTKMFWEKRNIDVTFRKEKRGGLMTVKGYEHDVFDFESYWLDDGAINIVKDISVYDR